MTFVAALRFLTIIKLGWLRDSTTDELKRSAGWFPMVGLLIGLILAGLNWLVGFILPQAVVNVLLIVASVLITGALHLDGFLDTCDGLGSHGTPEERWRIMDDSRAGGFGAIGVAVLLLTKYVSLNSIPASLLTAALILMPVLSRWAMVYAIFAYPYAKPVGLGKTIKESTSALALVLATVFTLAIAVATWWAWVGHFYFLGLALQATTWLLILMVAAYLKGKFGGLTGDCYGAINEVTEVWVLILFNIMAYNKFLGG
jgi:adenosylcobinamide-GDP ribazoletransferase